jgi:DNA-binding CsgD family transcriptional regulator
MLTRSPGEDEVSEMSTALAELSFGHPVGRESEFQRLTEALDSAVRGEGRVVLLSGPTAVGKTELLHAFTGHAAERGAFILNATGSVLERDFPFSVIRQLMQAAPFAPDVARQVATLLDEGSFPGCPTDALAVGRISSRVLHELHACVLQLAAVRPLVLSIDDVHNADAESVDFLLFLIRRIRPARILVVLSERQSAAPAHPMLEAELSRQAHFARVDVNLLPLPAVTEIISQRLGAQDAGRLAAAVHEVSGGNPLLVAALIEDQRAAAERDPAHLTIELAVGEAFSRAVVSCLYRMEPAALQIARALAVGAEASAPDRLGELVEIGTVAATQVLESLIASCLITGSAKTADAGPFRHPRTRAAVVGTMTRDERSRLHRRAALLLHSDGAAAMAIAAHLLAADGMRADWTLSVLQRAAEQGIAAGQPHFAVECLKLAQRASTDERQRAGIQAELAGLEWLLDPTAAARHLPGLVNAVSNRLIAQRQAMLAARCLAWYGRADVALAALELVGGPDGSFDVEAVAETRTVAAWLVYWYPGRGTQTCALLRRAEPVPAIANRIAGLELLLTVLQGNAQDVVARAERILAGRPMDASTLESRTYALIALVYADEAGRAERWSTKLIEQASGQAEQLTYALLCAVHADISLRNGNLAAAEKYAGRALELVPPEGWGVAVGVPLATVITATSAMGRLEEAARWADVPVPGAMFETPAGLQYLQACGRYNLAIDRVSAALHAFEACGSLMRDWGIDQPGIAAWRLEAAWAHLRLDARDAAASLVEEELARLPQEQSRSRGIALRIQAAITEPKRRPPVLWAAANILRAVGDTFEEASALADLAATYLELGEAERARTVARRALDLAKASGAEPLTRMLANDVLDPESAGASLTGPGISELSEAERRVAALAAQGHTNREIARSLFITVSTVEQHLTRVYRKLGVTRRMDLPAVS